MIRRTQYRSNCLDVSWARLMKKGDEAVVRVCRAAQGQRINLFHGIALSDGIWGLWFKGSKNFGL